MEHKPNCASLQGPDYVDFGDTQVPLPYSVPDCDCEPDHPMAHFAQVVITTEELKTLRKIRNYFGHHDKTPFEHMAYDFLDRLCKDADRHFAQGGGEAAKPVPAAGGTEPSQHPVAESDAPKDQPPTPQRQLDISHEPEINSTR